MENNDKELLIRTSESAKQAHKRIDSIEKKVEDIHEIACSVKAMAMEMKAMREDLNDTKNDVKDTKERVTAIEQEPGKNYKELKSKVVWQVISFILLTILTAVGVYIFK